jgi:BCL2-associated athanogene 3
MHLIKGNTVLFIYYFFHLQGSRSDKEYLYLDDMLTKHLISLDGIDTAGREEIRQLRKDSIAFVNKCLSRLDEKATENLSEQQQQQQQQQQQSKEDPATAEAVQADTASS